MSVHFPQQLVMRLIDKFIIQHSCQSCSWWELALINGHLTHELVVLQHGESPKLPENVNFLTKIYMTI
jgi:hypothetical protein